MSRTLTFLLAALLLSFSACSPGGTPTDKASDMTSDEALNALEKNSIELLEAISDKGTVSGTVVNTDIPCGGLGGNELSKVRNAYSALGESKDELDSNLETAKAKLTAMGLSISGPDSVPYGTSLSFRGEGFGGELIITSDHALSLDAQTECLDNPDR